MVGLVARFVFWTFALVVGIALADFVDRQVALGAALVGITR